MPVAAPTSARKSRLRKRPTNVELPSSTPNDTVKNTIYSISPNQTLKDSKHGTDAPTNNILPTKTTSIRRRTKRSLLNKTSCQRISRIFAIFVLCWIGAVILFVAYLPASNDSDSGFFLRKQQYSSTSSSSSSSELIDLRQLYTTLAFDNPDGGVWKQGWDIKLSKPLKPLKIFVVPHSHNDPGWIKTFDEYFQTQTKQIITTIITSLTKDPRRTFIWAEISYLSWWWEDQTEDIREKLKQLLRNKQLELVTGGWVQPDEANSNIYALQVQMEEGHDWIRTHLGEEFVPKYGWAIDPFGYSPTMAYLLKTKYKFQGMLIQRVHYAIKKHLAQHKHLEFNWRQVWDETGEHDMFTHVMPFFSYDVPHTCGPDPSVCCQFDFHRQPVGDGPSCPWKKGTVAVTQENVAERALLLLDQYRKKAELYRSNAVLIPLGDDFRYQSLSEAEHQFKNHQAIHDYINQHVDGVEIKFGTLGEYFQAVMGTFNPPMLKGSFFTYSDVNQDYWSGYFTSRVFDKALDRTLERVLYAAESLGAGTEELQEARRQLSLFQHHDGVTGTAKDHVVEDYAKRMHESVVSTQKWLLAKVKQVFPQEASVVSDLDVCWVSDGPRVMSQNICGEQSTVVVYNPLETPQMCGPIVVPGKQATTANLPCEVPGPLPGSLIRMEFDPVTGLMTHPIKEEWKYWQVEAGGAYLFEPGRQEQYNMADVIIENEGYVVTTPQWKRTVVEKQIDDKFGTKARALDFIYEFNLDRDDQEWFVRFSRDIKNDGVFHTDLNGFNFDTHKFRPDMPIQSQVFPMPTLASIEDSRVRMNVLSEHAQGTASLETGAIDVWLDRRLRQDDNRGLGQGVQDNRLTRTRLRVLLEAEGYTPNTEFQVTPLCQRMWDELQHPLEMFGEHSVALSPGNENMIEKARKNRERARERQRREIIFQMEQERNLTALIAPSSAGQRGAVSSVLDMFSGLFRRVPSATTPYTATAIKIPFVYMVYKRVDYLKKAIESLRRSDFPKTRVPIIISHDGHVPEVVQYVESLKSEFNVIQLFHPFSCYEHPDTFPGEDPKLNNQFRGDAFGNARTAWITCCKHHFTWMIKQVFDELTIENDDGSTVDTFLFLEEDYVVAPTIYTAVVAGLSVISQYGDTFFGVGLDPSQGNTRNEPYGLPANTWFADTFRSGPMTMSRSIFTRLQENAVHFCRFDDYNWDWSMVHLQGEKLLPHALLFPREKIAKHIGISDGMHNKDSVQLGPSFYVLNTQFDGTGGIYSTNVKTDRLLHKKGWGGWSHPADQEHCMKLLAPKTA